jgi:hypothetical protein
VAKILKGATAQETHSAILDLIRSSGTVTRVALADRSGLTGASISRVVKQLLAEGLIVETGLGDPGEVGAHRSAFAAQAEILGQSGIVLGQFDDAGRRGERFQAAVAAAPARRAVDLEHHVADLADVRRRAPVDVAVGDQAEAEARGQVERREVVGRRDAAGPELADRGAGRIVLDDHRMVDRWLSWPWTANGSQA